MAGETVLVIDDSPTILKVVQLVLTKAGFDVETAADGEAGIRVARETDPEVILLDFVMPRMNGYQFCREMNNDGELKDIPVVLMSAKGDQVGERFVKVMGIVDYITKPFSPEAITAVVQHTISKYARRPKDDYTNPLIAGSDVLAETTAAETAEREARSEVLTRLRDRLSEVVAARIAGLFSLADAAREEDGPAVDGSVPTDAAAIADATRAALDDDTMIELLRIAEPGVLGPLRGDLAVVPIAEILQLLDVQEQSGILRAARGQGRVQISFRKGRIALATAEGVSEEFLLGRFIVDNENR